MNAKDKPKKPYPDFPLYAHARGYWAKKIKGKLYYFGRWDDPDGALEEYERTRHDLYAGRTPAIKADGMPLKEAINRWLHDKRGRVDSGELSEDSWKEYRRIGRRIVAQLGETTVVVNLTPQDFGKLREKLVKGVSAKTGHGNVTKARTFFKWVFEAGYSPTPLPYMATLKAPSTSVIRREKANRPSRLFAPEELRAVIEKATGYMVPLLYLAINCGLGNRDGIELKWEYIDLKKGYINYDRPKTGIKRRAKLWPETIAALKAWQTEAPASEYVCCGLSGQQLGRGTNNTPIPHLFEGLFEAAKIKRNSRGFYAIRSTYRTIADETRDLVAIDLTMGHADHTMGGHYRQRIDDSRLDEIAEHVRQWLINSSGHRPEDETPSYV